jgi:hypothetical protein
MRRFRCWMVIGALAASVGVAAPAVAAKGGNSDNAHACQQGGHEHMFEAETGRPFKNAGDCVSHAAIGNDNLVLFIDPVLTDDCANCWGVLEGSVSPDANWEVFFSPMGTTKPFASGTADDSGDVIVNLDLPCGKGSTTAYAVDEKDQITTQTVDSPC